MSFLKISTIIIIVLLTSACVPNTSDIPLLNMSDAPFVGAFDTSTDEGKFLELYDFTDVSYDYDPVKITQDRRRLLRDSKGLVDSESLTTYSQSILDRIVASGPSVGIKPKVNIMAIMAPGAKVTRSGEIFINHSIFEYAQNEDQLAYVLAHEYSHILLKHHSFEEFEALRPYLLTAVDLMIQQYGNKVQSGEKDKAGLLAKTGKLYGSDLLIRDVLLPIWDRTDEFEADRMGIDLLAKAGYNTNEAILVLNREKDFNDKFESSFSKEKNALERFVEENKTENQNQLNLINIVSNGLIEFQKEFAATHPDPQERMLEVYSYMEREYPDSGFIDLSEDNFMKAKSNNSAVLTNYNSAFNLDRTIASSSDFSDVQFKELETIARTTVSDETEDHAYTRITFAHLREQQGNYKLALKNLELIKTEEGFLPLAMEKERIKWLEEFDKIEDAYNRTKEVGQYYDWPLSIYPDSIRLAGVMGDSNEVNSLTLSCVAKYPQSRASCQ